jgi:hypothetical protein
MLYNAEDALYEWKIHIQLKESYGWEDDSKEWLATVKVHHKKWKKIKQQAGKAAGSGRGGGGSGKKMQFTWKHVAEIAGEDLTLGGVWTQELAAQHFDADLKFKNDTRPRRARLQGLRGLQVPQVHRRRRRRLAHLHPRHRDAARDGLHDRAGHPHRPRRQRRRRRRCQRSYLGGSVGGRRERAR